MKNPISVAGGQARKKQKPNYSAIGKKGAEKRWKGKRKEKNGREK